LAYNVYYKMARGINTRCIHGEVIRDNIVYFKCDSKNGNRTYHYKGKMSARGMITNAVGISRSKYSEFVRGVSTVN